MDGVPRDVNEIAGIDSKNFFAEQMGDGGRAAGYSRAAMADDLQNPVADHTEADGGFITECPASGGGASCQKCVWDVLSACS